MHIIRVNEGCKVLGALKGLIKNRGLGMKVKFSPRLRVEKDQNQGY